MVSFTGPQVGQTSRKQELKSLLRCDNQWPLGSESHSVFRAPGNDFTDGRKGSVTSLCGQQPLCLQPPATVPTATHQHSCAESARAARAQAGEGGAGGLPSTGRTDRPLILRAANLLPGTGQRPSEMPAEKHLCKFITKGRMK